MKNAIMILGLLLLATNLAADIKVVREEKVSGNWAGVMMQNPETGLQVCGVKTMLVSVSGNTAMLFLTTDGSGITDKGRKVRYDMAVGPSKDSRIKIDDKEPHRVDRYLAGDRERLVKEFKNGKKAQIVWHDHLGDGKAMFSLNGFTKTYDTSKDWCEQSTFVAADEVAPTISLLGSAQVDIEAGTAYVDAGATAKDDKDGDISSKILHVGSVNTKEVGPYTITYQVSDAAGNAASPVTRTVNVTDDRTPPVITLVGYPSVSLEVGSPYVDAGTMVTDNIDGDISTHVISKNNVNTNIVGSYSVTFNAQDAMGNKATPVVRAVNVIADMTPPVINLVGYPSVSVEQGSTYVDAGAVGLDNIDGDISSNIVVTNSVNHQIVGSYDVIYHVMDAAGNKSIPVFRKVNVIADITPPVITLSGYPSLSIERGTNYIDAGAIASDNIDGDISANIIVTNSVNSRALGNYSVSYNVSDTAGNAATTIIRTVKVIPGNTPSIDFRSYVDVIRDEIIGGDWAGVIMRSHISGAHTCGIKTMVESSDGNAIEVLFSSHGEGISLNGSPIDFDFSVGTLNKASVQIDKNKPHLVDNYVASDRVRLIKEFKKGSKAEIIWMGNKREEKFEISLKGFTRAYDTAKDWCKQGVKETLKNNILLVDTKDVSEEIKQEATKEKVIKNKGNKTGVIIEEVFSKNWTGVMMNSGLSGAEVCAVKSKVFDSDGNSADVILTTHRLGISNSGDSVRYDLSVGSAKDLNIKVDDNVRHQVEGYLVDDRKELIKEFRKGTAATIFWQQNSKEEESTLSLKGFSKAYRVAKAWCDLNSKLNSNITNSIDIGSGTDVIRKEVISENWAGLMTKNDTSESETCGVITVVEYSQGKTAEVLLTTHSGKISNNSDRRGYDLAVGSLQNVHFKVDDEELHQVQNRKLSDHERLINEFKKGKEVSVSWDDNGKTESIALSLKGFSKAYETAKGWCE